MNDIEALRKWTYERMSEVLADPKLKDVILITTDIDGTISTNYNGDTTNCELIGYLEVAKSILVDECKDE